MALVEKTLKGETFDAALVTRTQGGLPIQPLYVADGTAPIGRDLSERDPDRPWDLRTHIVQPDLAKANADILRDLEGGAASVLITLDPTAQAGVAIGSPEALTRLLEGVLIDLAPVALDAGFLGPKAADWLGAAAKSAPNAPLAFHLDPLSAFAETGASPGPVESHIISAATVAARLATTYPKASLFLASGQVAHEAGASEAQELAVMAASALAYAKALVRAGLSMEDAFKGIVIGLAVDGEYFVGVAKLRAARAVWDRITAACGVSVPARIEARSSRRMLTRLDPWTNLLRLTAAGFAAAVGGAQSIVLGTFTDAIGRPTEFARRQARNTQLVLMEEAHLGQVADPAGGAWYLDQLTEALAKAAWTEFQAIEAAGGIVAALSSGLIAGKVAESREAILASGRKVLGVTVFRNPDEKPVEVDTTPGAPVEAPSVRLPGPDGHCPLLTPIRLSADLEA
ncbi:methylmalonyl-CoA mutase family protein [Caulobacter ginsengisoli]|nr:methylmalonyl-CoA mutase family protein [Caulobacter ginsengisoli]